MEPLELPECPVCLQTYGGESTTPRVIACGHSVCEACLTQLPKPFPFTIRCPECNQLVKYPHPQGPSALPKNIDLLRLSSLLQNPNLGDSQKPRKPNKQSSPKNEHQFIPNLWPREFYSNWKDWVVPNDAVLVEPSVDDGLCAVLLGRIVNSSDPLGSPILCLLKENQMVSLVRVGCSSHESDSKFKYSYIAKILQALYGMKEAERAELGLILRASCSSPCRICKVYGFWYNSDNRCVYMVCERYKGALGEKLGDLANGVVGGDENNGLLDTSNFAMIGMEICESVSGLNSKGLVTGCLALSCFNFDDVGHVYVDFNEVLAMGRRVRRIIAEAVSGKQKIDEKAVEVCLLNFVLKTHVFVSPELFLELLQKEGIDLGSGSSRYAAGHGSDVWSLACVLLWLLIGKPFTEEMCNYLHCLILSVSDDKGFDFMGIYTGWMEKVSTLLETKLGSEFVSLQEILGKCLNFDPISRPVVTDLWKYIRMLILKPNFDILVSSEQMVIQENTGHCLVLGEVCQLSKETNKGADRQIIHGLPGGEENSGADVIQVGEVRVDNLVEGLSGGHVKCIDLKGHLACITGLAVGGGFLFSSSFDKTVHVWSLQDFTHVHSFRGHENKVMAVAFVNEEPPLCISGDSGGGIFIWGISIPFGQEPIKKWCEQNDWRYTGIHALATSGNQYLYTGSGDKSIKAWSLKDYTLSSTMNGHKSVVSTLAVCDGVLYSGSWDGTIRLWSLNDHSPLTLLGDDAPGNVISVLSIAVDRQMLVVAHENGSIKIWKNDVLMKSIEGHKGAIFSVGMEGKWLFSGGWDKTLNVQELSGDDFGIDAIPIGSIACDAVITALLYWQGKLLVGHADRLIKVYCCGS
ncbi:hypothetical protein F0562_002818 [Nyssa sinensis]|uniref:RING-type domain-containing protein n=1 Tax=Nyssa sinensis TaxID=561372 RepID=A0A5J5BTM7_9ASTE|nr:hypothetical protein F0562_002818 [Nyssa sinensis]